MRCPDERQGPHGIRKAHRSAADISDQKLRGGILRIFTFKVQRKVLMSLKPIKYGTYEQYAKPSVCWIVQVHSLGLQKRGFLDRAWPLLIRWGDDPHPSATMWELSLPASIHSASEQQTVYNIASQSLATIDANGNRVSSVHDALGRRTVEVNALGNRTTTVYNSLGQTSALVDARANRHSFTYDSTGAQTQLIDPLNRRTTSAYDAAGQQNLRIDARGNRTTYAYSSVGQLTSRRYPNGTRATFSYDTIGNRTLMADSTGRYTSTFDAVGQTTSVSAPGNRRSTFTYDVVGLRRSTEANGAGRTTTTYDAAGRLAASRTPSGERTTFSCDDIGRKSVERNPNGSRVSLSYDAASQTTQIIQRSSVGMTLQQLDSWIQSLVVSRALEEGVDPRLRSNCLAAVGEHDTEYAVIVAAECIRSKNEDYGSLRERLSQCSESQSSEEIRRRAQALLTER